MKKILLTLIVSASFIFTESLAQNKIDWNHYKALLKEKNYKKAYNDAMLLRKEPYGKCFQVDYIITKCICGSNKPEVAKKCFSLLNKYPLTPKLKQLVDIEQDNCLKTTIVNMDDEILAMLNIIIKDKTVLPEAKSSGKMGYVLNCKKTTTNPGDFDLKIELSEEEFSKRIFAVNEKSKAFSYYNQMLGAEYKIDTVGRFVLITMEDHGKTPSDIIRAAENLQKAYNFYAQHFKIRPPDKLITVYLMGNKNDLQDVALKIHRLNLPSENIGYSSLADLSVLGTSNSRQIGTIYHELFHLFVRADVGDIPAWLDEGIASLYETSSWKGDSLLGDVANWRTMVVRQFLRTSPNRSLEYIINKNWEGFSINPNNDLCDLTVNYAYSKHFAIFLQEKNLLSKMLAAFRDQKNVFVDSTYINQTDIELVESCFNKKMEFIQMDFENWFDQTYNFSLKNKDQISQIRMIHNYLEVLRYNNLDPEAKITLTNHIITSDLIEKTLEQFKKDSENTSFINAPIQQQNQKQLTDQQYNERRLTKLKIEEFINTANKFIAEWSDKH